MKILFFFADVVDGHKLNNILTAKKPFPFEMCYSGKEFQEKFKAFVPDTVVFDLDLEGELLKKINEVLKTKFPRMRRIFLCTFTDRENFAAWYKSPLMGQAYLKKPLDLDLLTLIVTDMEEAISNAAKGAPPGGEAAEST